VPVQPSFDYFMPESRWTPPAEFPNLRGNAQWIGVDIEARDENLQKYGPGFVRDEAYIVGVSIAADGFQGYFPVRHEGGGNLAENAVFQWLADTLGGDEPKYGANLLYDAEGLRKEGVELEGPWHDIQIAEALIDEDSLHGYSLEALAYKYLGESKDERLLRDAANSYSIGKKRLNPKKDMWMMPAKFVGAYAEQDAVLPRKIFREQEKIFDKEDLWDIFFLEQRVTPVLLEMRFKGVRVDLERAGEVAAHLRRDEAKMKEELRNLVGWAANVWSPKELPNAYKVMGIKTPLTPRGNPSITAPWLELQEDELSKLVIKLRKSEKMRRDFIEGDIIGKSVNGRLYATFVQLKNDEGGTKSGRFASKSPNLQQVPSRDPYYGPLIRSMFIADEGELFCKADYSQQEPRLFLHYAYLMGLGGAKEAVDAFKSNPSTDYHQLTTDIVNFVSGGDYARKKIKGINLGISYTMGIDKLCTQLNLPRDEGEEILSKYHVALPYVKGLINACMKRAADTGVIIDIVKRHHRFPLWEPSYANRKQVRPRTRAEALKAWPNERLKRADTHKAINKLIQGSAAGQTKKAIVDLWENHGIVMSLQVHDELAGSVPDRETAMQVRETMMSCVPLVLPSKVDLDLGPNWADGESI